MHSMQSKHRDYSGGVNSKKWHGGRTADMVLGCSMAAGVNRYAMQMSPRLCASTTIYQKRECSQLQLTMSPVRMSCCYSVHQGSPEAVTSCVSCSHDFSINAAKQRGQYIMPS